MVCRPPPLAVPPVVAERRPWPNLPCEFHLCWFTLTCKKTNWKDDIGDGILRQLEAVPTLPYLLLTSTCAGPEAVKSKASLNTWLPSLTKNAIVKKLTCSDSTTEHLCELNAIRTSRTFSFGSIQFSGKFTVLPLLGMYSSYWARAEDLLKTCTRKGNNIMGVISLPWFRMGPATWSIAHPTPSRQTAAAALSAGSTLENAPPFS